MALSLLLSGCATDGAGLAQRWALRGAGGLAGFALHEACHLAVGASFGAEIDVGWSGYGPNLEFDRISSSEHRAVAVAGNFCTGMASEWIVRSGRHRRSHFLEGLAWFHAINSFGYAFATHGDAEHFVDAGGSRIAWISLHGIHGASIATRLVVNRQR